LDIKVEVGQAHERTLKVHTAWDELKPSYEKKLNDLNKKVKRPGFRPGKIPRQIMTSTYGPAVLADLVEDWVQKAYMQAVIENNWEPIKQVSIDDMQEFDEGKDLDFTLSLEVEPDIALPDYKSGYKVTRPKYIPSDEDVEHALGHLQERYAQVETREDGALEGDLIMGDLQYLDESGLPIIGRKVEDRYIKVGEGVFGGDVLQQLTGAKTGDDIRFTIPGPDKGEEDLHVQLTVKAVESHVLPELNDAFAKTVNPELEDFEALKAEVLEDINEQLKQDAERALRQAIADHMVQKSKVDIPESMVVNYLDRFIERVKQEQGDNVDEEEIRSSNRDRADWELKWYLARKKLVRAEELQVTEEDIDAKIDKLTEKMPGDKTKIKALYRDKQYLPQIREDILDEKVFVHLISFAKVKEKKVNTKEIGGYHGHAH